VRATVALAAVLLAACGAPQQVPAPAAPLEPRATVVIEPPHIGIGQVAVIEVAAVTPAGHRVHPIAPPESVDGLWILDAVAEPVERAGERWTHRTRIRVRGRRAGRVEWPPLELDVEGPEGERWSLRTEALPIEVISARDLHPSQLEPFSYRLPAAGKGVSPLAAAGAGALGALGLIGMVAFVRRARRRRAARPPMGRAAAANRPWTGALRELERAGDEIDGDWRGAGGRAAGTMRRYLGLRFGLAAESATTEELEAAVPPFPLARRWPGALALLRALDDARFRPGRPDGSSERERLRETLAGLRGWIEDTIPPEDR
jgi:hypothetical protein